MAPYLSIRVLLLNGGVSLLFVEPATWALYAVISHRAVARSGRGCQRSSGPRFVKVLAWPGSSIAARMASKSNRGCGVRV